MWLVLVLSFTGLFLVEYMVPFSRNIKWIENASQAFYESYAWVEESVLLIHSGSIWQDYTNSYSWDQDFKYSVDSSGRNIPVAWNWNSEYDSDWNRISQDNPISLVVGNNIFWWWSNSINLEVRVPDFDGNGSSDNLEVWTYDDIVFWQISSNSDSLSVKDILDISTGTNSVSRNLFSPSEVWLALGDSILDPGNSLANFYANNCISSECVLKISLVNPIISPDNSLYPYLEYRISTSDSIPLSHSYITSDGKSYGFTKKLEVAIPQQSTSSAFDFTVLQ